MESESGRFEAQTTGDSRVEENEWSGEDMPDSMLMLEHPEDYESRDHLAKALELTIVGHGRDSQKVNEAMKQHIAENGHRLEELAKRAEAERFASMGKSARSNADAEGETLPSLHELTSSLTELADAVDEEDRRERQLKSRKIQSEGRLLLEEYERRRLKDKEKAQRTELSISEMESENSIVEELQAIKDRQSRRRGAEERTGTYEAGSSGNHGSYNSGPEDDLRDNIDAELRRMDEVYVREEREDKEQEDPVMAALVRSRKEVLQIEADKQDQAHNNMDLNDLRRQRLAEAGFTQAQIDEMMTNEHEREQRQAPATPKTASGLAGDPIKPHAPTYPKIHANYATTKALIYYDLPWEYDKVIKTQIAVFGA